MDATSESPKPKVKDEPKDKAASGTNDVKNRGWPKGKKRYPKSPGAPKQPPKLPSGPLQKAKVPPVVLKKPLGPPPQKTEQKPESQTFLKKPLENFPKKSFVKPKPNSLSPVIARLTQQTKVQDKKTFDFR